MVKYHFQYEVRLTMMPKDIVEKWFARETEIDAWREEELKKSFEMIQKSFHYVWD